MKTAAASLLLFMVLGATPVAGHEQRAILGIGGDGTWGVGINGRAVGWSVSQPQYNVTVSANLGNGGGHAYLDAYLVRSVGPGTTREDEVARTSLDLPYPFTGWVTLFEGLELEEGEYWLVIAKPRDRAHSSINWIATNSMTLRRSCDVQYLGTRSYTLPSDAASYLPASKFAAMDLMTYGFGIRVSGTPAASCRTSWR